MKNNSGKIDVFNLYNELWRIAINQPKGKVILDEGFIDFFEHEVIKALEYQMECCDVPAAIEECLKRGWLRKDGDIFHFTDSGMDIYSTGENREC